MRSNRSLCPATSRPRAGQTPRRCPAGYSRHLPSHRDSPSPVSPRREFAQAHLGCDSHAMPPRPESHCPRRQPVSRASRSETMETGWPDQSACVDENFHSPPPFQRRSSSSGNGSRTVLTRRIQRLQGAKPLFRNRMNGFEPGQGVFARPEVMVTTSPFWPASPGWRGGLCFEDAGCNHDRFILLINHWCPVRCRIDQLVREWQLVRTVESC